MSNTIYLSLCIINCSTLIDYFERGLVSAVYFELFGKSKAY